MKRCASLWTVEILLCAPACAGRVDTYDFDSDGAVDSGRAILHLSPW